MYFYGLGEFFYTNGIEVDEESFMNVKVSSFLKEGDHEVVEDFKNPSALRASPFKKGDKIFFQ